MDDNRLTLIAKLLEQRRTIDDNGCWLYQGTQANGYGVLYFDGDRYLVHRVSYRIYYGVDPYPLLVCHSCDVPACFNPKHLFAGTHKDNMDDMRAKGRAHYQKNPNWKPTKKTGGEADTSKFPALTKEQILFCKTAYGRGMTQRQLAEKFNVSIATVSRATRCKI